MKESLRLVKAYYLVSALLPLEAFLAPVIIIFYLDYLGTTFLQYSNFIAVLFILNLVAEVPMGFVSDRIGRRRALVLGNAVYMVGLALILAIGNVWVLIPAALFLSIGQSLSSGNLDSIGYEVFSANNTQTEFQSFLNKMGSLAIGASAIGAFVGGKLSDVAISLPMFIDVLVLCGKTLFGVVILIILWPSSDNTKPEGLRRNSSSLSEIRNVTEVLLSPTFLAPLVLSTIAFMVFRTSLNFYQPILTAKGWDGEALGILFALGILGSAGISYAISGSVLRFLNIQRTTFGFLVVVLLCGLFFSKLENNVVWFVLAFVLHQVARVIVPAVASNGEQRAIPSEFRYRTAVVSFSLLIRALVASFAVTITGYAVDDRIGNFQGVLIALHLVAAAMLGVSLILAHTVSTRKMGYTFRD